MERSERSTQCANRYQELSKNPFLVLGISPAASRVELEREGAKLLASLAAGVEMAATYETAEGKTGERTAELVRHCVAELRDPARRLQHEWWFSHLVG